MKRNIYVASSWRNGYYPEVYGIPSSIGSSKDWPYRKFYQTDGKVDMEKVAKLMEHLKIAPGGNENQAEDQ